MATTAPNRPTELPDPSAARHEGRRLPTLETGVATVLAAVAFAVGSRVVTDNSFLTHLTTGDLIRFEGAVPRSDPYSWTAAGEPWTVQSWFASLVYSWLAEIGSGSAVRLFNGGMTLLVVLGVTSVVRRHRASLLAGAVAVGLGVAIGATMWTPRPLLFGLVGITAVLVALLPDRGPDAALRPSGLSARPWLLVPIMWLWVQSHGSFPLALVLCGLVVVGSALDRRRLPIHEATVTGWVGLGTLLGAVNPLGAKLLVFPFQLLGNSEALEGVAEWKRVDLDRPVEWMFAVWALLVVLALARRVEARMSLPALVFTLAGLWAVRNIGVAVIVAAPAVAAGLRGLPAGLRADDRPPLAGVLAGVGALGLVALPVVVLGQGALDLTSYPQDAVDLMVDRGLAGSADDRILHRDTVGNYLHYRLGTDAGVFVDDRFDFYPLEVLEDHRRLVLADDDLIVEEILDRHAPTAVLWQRDTFVGDWLEASPAWELVYEDDDWVVATPGS